MGFADGMFIIIFILSVCIPLLVANTTTWQNFWDGKPFVEEFIVVATIAGALSTIGVVVLIQLLVK